MSIKIVIVGGVAGGATAAARARRLNETAQILLIERGPYISFANCGLPYYIGGVIEQRDNLLVTTAEAFTARYAIDIRSLSEVTAIDRTKKAVEIHNLATGKTYREPYDKLILSPGADPIKLGSWDEGLEGVFTLRTVPDADRIKAWVDQKNPREAVVVGGGFIGLEMADNLARKGLKVTILEMADQVMAPLDFEMAALLHGHLQEKGISLRLEEGVKSIAPREGRVGIATTRDQWITSDLVILSAGIRPENELAKKAGLKLGVRGHIRVDAGLRTSDPDIFAVGDAAEVWDLITGRPATIALAGPANRQARIAADNALGRSSVYRGALGTSIVQVFEMTAAITGCAEKSLKAANIPYQTSYIHMASHASYYPGAGEMAIKTIYSPAGGRLLGAQIVGRDGVDKRIDVLATAIKGGLSVFELEELELAYAPPFSSAKDPINVAGMVAGNTLKGDQQSETWFETTNLDPEKDVLIDLRTQGELDLFGGIEGALHIPMDDLRSRLGELDKSKKYHLFCAAGLRGYVAHRIMVQHGFDSVNISGGILTYFGAKDKLRKT